VSLFNTLGAPSVSFFNMQGIKDELKGMNKEVNKELSLDNHKNY